MTILCIAAAMSTLSLGLLVGFDLCIDLPSDMARARAVLPDRARSGEDMMG